MFNTPKTIITGDSYLDAGLLEEIRRNLSLLYSTAEGTCPGDRNFGMDQSFEDYPVNVAQNLFALEAIEKTEIYENRAEILDISYGYSEDGNITPVITIGLKDADDIEDDDDSA